MQLPKVLKDAAVQAHYLGEEDLLGEPYVRLKVTFQQAGGGVDYQDEYRYWIHQKTHLLDFLAYRFYSGKGGTRFRKVSHRKRVNGMIFQNYENFSPPTPYPLWIVLLAYTPKENSKKYLIYNNKRSIF
jgi:hypothetical protein